MSSPATVAKAFVKVYFDTLLRKKQEIGSSFYGEKSTLTIAGESKFVGHYVGSEVIQNKFNELSPFVVIINSIDAVESIDNSIIVVVMGKEEAQKSSIGFSRTFVLVKSNNAFFVRTDIVRFFNLNTTSVTPLPPPSNVNTQQQQQTVESPSNTVTSPVTKSQPVVNKTTQPTTTESNITPVANPVVNNTNKDEKESPKVPVIPASSIVSTKKSENTKSSNKKNNKKSDNEVGTKPTATTTTTATTTPAGPTTWASRVSGSTNTNVNANETNDNENQNTTTSEKKSFKKNDNKKNFDKKMTSPKSEFVPKSLFVTRIPADITEEDLNKTFATYGTIVNIDYNTQKNTASVTYTDDSAVVSALKQPVTLKSTTLQVTRKQIMRKPFNKPVSKKPTGA